MLEVEEQTLENAIALYARGQELTKHCAQLLENAELNVRSLDESETDAGGGKSEDAP